MIQFFAAEPTTITIVKPSDTPVDPQQEAMLAEQHRLEVEQAITAANLVPLPDNLGQEVDYQV